MITEPSVFYRELCRRAASADRRVTLSALYLGNGEKEASLVEAIRANMAEKKGLRVSVLLDYCRGNRLSASGTSSCTMLQALVKQDKVTCLIRARDLMHLNFII